MKSIGLILPALARDRTLGRYVRSQGGYTLVELIIASALSVVVMTGLTSVVLTSIRAGDIASGRVQASSQIRNFEFQAYDDFARSGMPNPSGCGTAADPCTTSPIVLQGPQVANSTTPGTGYQYVVTYTWDNNLDVLDRRVGSAARHSATNVTAFSWYLDGQTVVVSLTVTIQFGTFQSYAQSQTFRFYPRLNP